MNFIPNKFRCVGEGTENDYDSNTYETDTYLPFIEVYSLAVRGRLSRVTLGFVPWLCHILSEYDLSNCLTSLSLSFLTYKIRT